MSVKPGLHAIRHCGADKFFLGLLFFLLGVFPAVPYSDAVTIRAIYTDAQGVGFNDTAALYGRRTMALLGG